MSNLPKLVGLIVATLLFSGSALSQRSVFEEPYKAQVAVVKIRAISTSIHAGSQNQDTYLAEILRRSGDWQLAKLIDVYAPDDSRIAPEILKSLPILRMKVTRSRFCDLATNQFFLSEKSVLFDDAVNDDLSQHPLTLLPCYQIVHRSIRLGAKGSLHSH